MADVIKEYAIQIQVQGSKAVIKEMKSVDGQIGKQNKHLKETNSLLWTYAKRLVGIYAIYKMFRKGIDLGLNFAEQGNQLKTLSSIANTSTKSLQKWGIALKRIGGDDKGVASIMGEINQKIYNRRFLGKDEFKDLITDYGAGTYLQATNAEDFLIGIAKKMEQYKNEFAKNDILLKAGISDGYLGRFLKQGEKKVRQDLKEAQVLFSDEDIAKAEKAQKALADFNLEISKLAKEIGNLTVEPITNLVKELTNFLKDPKSYIKTALQDTETSPYGTAKSMFDFRKTGMWYIKQMLGLQKFSSTTGVDLLEKAHTRLSKNILGKDYEGAMSLFEGIGSRAYDENQKYIEQQKGWSGDVQVENNINIDVSEGFQVVKNKLQKAYQKTEKVIKAVYEHSQGIN